eukprot:snap_masked-scaffold_52-processed-gene-1.64-mRNA-1 protein AED:1.00 eAED:1.00 QI:0/-1/0/0/-1/1/1/0/482
MKPVFEILILSLLLPQVLCWCNYDCTSSAGSTTPLQNYMGSFTLRDPSIKAFFPKYTHQTCEPTLPTIPQPMFTKTNKFIQTCSNTLSIYQATVSGIKEVATFQSSGEILDVKANIEDILIVSETGMAVLDNLLNLKFELSSTEMSENLSQLSAGSNGQLANNYYSVMGTDGESGSLVKVSRAGVVSSVVEVGFTSKHIINGMDEVFVCEDRILKKIDSTGVVSSLGLSGSCGGLLVTSSSRIILGLNEVDQGQSRIISLDTEMFSANWMQELKVIDGTISGLSRSAAVVQNVEKASISVVTSDGTFTIDDSRSLVLEKGSAQTRLEIEDSGFAQTPFAIDTVGNVAFTRSGEVGARYGSSQVTFYASNLTSDLDFRQNVFSVSSALLAVDKSGVLTFFKECTRYTIGDEVPSNACPAADLPGNGDLPVGVVIVAASSGLVLIPTALYSFRKMKLTKSEEEESDSDSDSESEPESEDESDEG